MDKQFVDKNINITRGDEALELIKSKNDKEFLEEGVVKKVSEERWKEAQEFERNTWCVSNARGMSTDRNEDHMKGFQGYAQLNFNLHRNDLKLIELGCGPFTNLRLISPQIYKTIASVDLLDPLISDYMKHTANCAFKNGYLNGRKANLIESGIEDFETDEQYDIIVMMNVLEHCRDIDLIFDKIQKMMHKDSLFVFHDVSVEDDKIGEIMENHYDAGHPILLTDSYLKSKIAEFKVLYRGGTIGNKDHQTVHYYILKK